MVFYPGVRLGLTSGAVVSNTGVQMMPTPMMVGEARDRRWLVETWEASRHMA
ncbi:MAG: hypothetical protein OXI96_01110 [Acidimicrobiaceae bacterium]|nr:hypothetical protein [Acidimicrobiaceae bacterium]